MKKILIIQIDDAYFLNETLQVLEKSHLALRDLELTLLVSPRALETVSAKMSPLIQGITTDVHAALRDRYDMSFNLSLNEFSWEIHGQVKSDQKAGARMKEGKLCVMDLWSTFYLTVKSQPPFLTFHLQDIFKNILGLRRLPDEVRKMGTVREIVLGRFNPNFQSEVEASVLEEYLRAHYPHISLTRIEQVDFIADLSHILYIGPASLEALKLCEEGASGLILGRKFHGMNLLPYEGPHHYVSTKGEALKSEKIFPLIDSLIKLGKPNPSVSYSVYRLETENLYGTRLEALNTSDVSYPFYQGHVVLWNFLLSLFEVNLDVASCDSSQVDALTTNQQTLVKLLRLHDYALKSVDTLYHESRSEKANPTRIDESLQQLAEIDTLMSKISESHPMLRPFLDFYRIRRGQNDGNTLLEQVQHSFLTYSEEHHALTALSDLFSVTLRKNEVSIR